MFRSFCNMNNYSAECECSAAFSCASSTEKMDLRAHAALAACAFLFLLAGAFISVIIAAALIYSLIISIIIIAVIIKHRIIYAFGNSVFDF